MKPSKLMENSKFQFHLDQLKKYGYVDKDGDKYRLTHEGKKIVARMNGNDGKIILQSKLGVAVICTRDGLRGREFLIYTRLKQPFFGCQGFLAGKIEYGEKIVDTAIREMKEEVGLEGDVKIVGLNHYFTRVEGEVADDLMQFMVWVDNPSGKLKGCKEGKYEWVEEKELKEFIQKPFQSKEQFFREIDLVNKYDGSLVLSEVEWEDVERENY